MKSMIKGLPIWRIAFATLAVASSSVAMAVPDTSPAAAGAIVQHDDEDSEDGGVDSFGTIPGTVVVSYLVGADGAVSECKMDVDEGRLFGTAGTRDPCPPKHLAPPRDASGKAVARRYRFTIKIEAIDGK